MKPFSLLIKPASADCNLCCDYCFYLERKSLYPESDIHRMPPEVLEKLVASFMKISQHVYSFGWQGGEPSLMGVDFYRQAVKYQQENAKGKAVISNAFQTNAVLIDDEFARFFAEYNFLLGVSLDGPAEIHDFYRKDLSGAGSHTSVMKAIDTLKRNKAEFNILCLVNALNVKKPADIYDYYQKHGFKFLQFIPCVEFDSQNNHLPFAITGKEWGEFLCGIFDSWYKSDARIVSIRLFDSILHQLVNGQSTVCAMQRDCRQYFVVEYNGDIYPCDFFVRKELKLGNVMENTWEEMLASEKYKEFGKQKAQWQTKCSKCEFLPFCAGDCLKHRLYGSVTTPQNLSWLCEGWKIFYAHTLPKFRKIAKSLKKN